MLIPSAKTVCGWVSPTPRCRGSLCIYPVGERRLPRRGPGAPGEHDGARDRQRLANDLLNEAGYKEVNLFNELVGMPAGGLKWPAGTLY